MQPLKFRFIDNKMPRQLISEFFSCLGNMSAKETAEDPEETCVYYVSHGFGIPQQFAKGYDLVF